MTDEQKADPLALLWCATGGTGTGFHAIRLRWQDKPLTLWSKADDEARYRRLCAHHGEKSDAEVTAVPLAEEGHYRLHSESSCLWIRTHNGETVRRLAAFEPVPTLILQEGDSVRRTAFWALDKPLSPEGCEKVNRHLAHHLRAQKMHAACSFQFRPPGAVIRHGRKRPIEVTVKSQTEAIYKVGEVCRRLPRVIPNPDAWRQNAA